MRRTFATLAFCLALAAQAAHAAGGIDPAVMKAMFEQSQNEKKGLTVFLGGEKIAIVVTKVNADSVEGRNQEYQRVVIRLDQIQALGLQ